MLSEGQEKRKENWKMFILVEDDTHLIGKYKSEHGIAKTVRQFGYFKMSIVQDP